jgi:hypothetical protein
MPGTGAPSASATTTTPQGTETSAPTTPGFDVASLGGQSSAALGGETAGFATPGGYLDQAIPMTMFRLRYDAGFDMNHPDRAEFFYAEWKEMAFHTHGINGDGVFGPDPHARGPDLFPGKLDYQEASAYFEVAANHRFSVFADVPLRFVDFDNLFEDRGEPGTGEIQGNGKFFPEPAAENETGPHTNFAGLSDVSAGFKFAFIADPGQYLTFQFTTYAPSGDPSRGLGTGHWTVEPAVLAFEQPTERLMLQAELKDWIPIDGGAFAGNVLTYGVGVGYDVYHNCNLRVVPITEFVGWTVLNGYESFVGPVSSTLPTGFVLPPGQIQLPTTHGVENASGDTIVNAKFGVRTYFGQCSDVYVGYGHSLTGDRWYRDIWRAEYRIHF